MKDKLISHTLSKLTAGYKNLISAEIRMPLMQDRWLFRLF